MGSLTITYCGPGQRPLSIATIDDPDLLEAAAIVAIEQAEEKAETTARRDPVMGRLQRLEAGRLRAALAVLIPGLASPEGFCISKSAHAIVN